jgi:hypothetical protein
MKIGRLNKVPRLGKMAGRVERCEEEREKEEEEDFVVDGEGERGRLKLGWSAGD